MIFQMLLNSSGLILIIIVLRKFAWKLFPGRMFVLLWMLVLLRLMLPVKLPIFFKTKLPIVNQNKVSFYVINKNENINLMVVGGIIWGSVAVIFLGTFFQLVLMVSDSVSSVDKNLLNAAKTLGANTWQTYRLVLFPAALPGILDNFRLSIGWAWTYLVVAEMIAANSGLGYLIIKSQRFLKTDNIFAGLILIGIIGLITDFLFKLLTKIIAPWYERLSEH